MTRSKHDDKDGFLSQSGRKNKWLTARSGPPSKGRKTIDRDCIKTVIGHRVTVSRVGVEDIGNITKHNSKSSALLTTTSRCCLLLQYLIQSCARGEEDSGGHVL